MKVLFICWLYFNTWKYYSVYMKKKTQYKILFLEIPICLLNFKSILKNPINILKL